MDWREHLRSSVKAGRRRRSIWVQLFDIIRLIPSAEGRARLWTLAIHTGRLHQTSARTSENRYPILFDMAARLAPDARRILSFGCSTGQELLSIRTRFPSAEIVGVEINPRSRRLAAIRTSSDELSFVVGPNRLEGSFDVIFALAVLQREPHKVAELEMDNLSRHYPFERFDAAVAVRCTCSRQRLAQSVVSLRRDHLVGIGPRADIVEALALESVGSECRVARRNLTPGRSQNRA